MNKQDKIELINNVIASVEDILNEDVLNDSDIVKASTVVDSAVYELQNHRLFFKRLLK